MDFFFCLPVIFGCPTKISPEGDVAGRVCPRCHNAAVYSASSRTWLEICFVPLIPFSKNHIWMCGICQWNVPIQQGWEPAVPGPAQNWPQQQPWPPQPYQAAAAHGGPGPYRAGYQPPAIPPK